MIEGLLAVLVSASVLWRLAGRDPKRLRAARQRDRRAHAPVVRRGLLLLALLPGLGLLLWVNVAAVLVWFGGLTVSGWLIAELRAPR